ncbi:SGNH/GDSL hydrolase family protein [Flavobacterium sp.]|uniref:SGNH/GDSL hydrolase family protein n=1 Tax=Flavobacterium sp. TaxID=239 RepID=UPI0039E47BEA
MKKIQLLLILLLFTAMSEHDTPESSASRIVMMGDSITQGWPLTDPAFFEGKNITNKGIGGQTTPQMLARFEKDVLALRPKIVVIMAGTNDIAGNTGPMTLQMTLDNIVKMTEMAKANKIKVVLCSVLPANGFPWNRSIQPADKIIALNQMIKAYADKNKIVYADYYRVTVDQNKGLKKEFSGDGVHPNKKGYQAMEPVLERAIAAVSKK